ncbi:MAG TPA: branched-chain amino acid ABC transporter permease [Candidatus Acidoferrales bacterium]|nr:branched-chain amino acid ABC transporter permease [Candidatus Acidoferrales bacterium]HVC38808.1 branched-chain amino acid ABC transporter permease [Candidatus Dormibacteraeota bacterium]
MSLFIASVGFGIVTAAVLAIAAVGFTVQFGVTEVLNLAYASVMIACAYIAYLVNQTGQSVWLGMVAAAVAGALISLLINKYIYAPFQRRGTSHTAVVIVSLGVLLIIEFTVQALEGPANVSYTMSQGSTFVLGGLILTTVQFIIIGLSLAFMVGLHLVLRYTRFGKAMRATAADRTLARNCGIRTDRVVTLACIFTGALCGIAGTVFAINSGSFGATSADLFLVLILAAVFLGGPGQPYGAMVGALVIGLATEVSAVFITSDYKYVSAFVILLVILAVRPRGLFNAGAIG